MGSPKLFRICLVWSYYPSDFSFLHPLDDKCVPLYTAIGWDGVFRSFCLGLSGTMILLISAFQVARIIRVSHWHPANLIFF
jgi:hypothetical protein